MNIGALTSGLVEDDMGIWKGITAEDLSYPEEGHSQCYVLEDRSFWFRHRNDCILSVIHQFPPDGAILDVGGGNGYVTRKMIDEGYDAVLLEPGATGAFNGRVHRGIPQVVCATLETAQFSAGSFGAIGCFDVIEHIEDDRAFIDQVHGLLAPGGLLYATVPAHQYLWSLSDVSARHYRRYNKETVMDLLGSDFEMEYFTYFFSALTPLIYLFRTLPYQAGLSRKSNVLSAEAEHGMKEGIAQKIINGFLQHELRKINGKMALKSGASCLWAARKKGDDEFES